MTDLNEIAKTVNTLAHEKGWYDDYINEDVYLEKICNNFHDEVSELHEAHRNHKLRELCDKSDKMIEHGIEPLTCVEEEIADIIIRALDNCIQLNLDPQSIVERKHRFNMTRPYRHGGKKS